MLENCFLLNMFQCRVVSKKDVSSEMLLGKIEFLRVAVPMYEDMNADELRTLTLRRPSPLKVVGSVTYENPSSEAMQLNSFSPDERTNESISQSISTLLNAGLDRRTYIRFGTQKTILDEGKSCFCRKFLGTTNQGFELVQLVYELISDS